MQYKLSPCAVNGSTSCFDSAISAILYNSVPSYLDLYYLFWGFIYTSKGISNIKLSERFMVGGLHLQLNDFYNSLFGMKIYEHPKENVSFFLNAVQQETNRGFALILSIDTYDCPWNVGYRKLHLEHFVVITGWNEEERTLLCHDAFCGIDAVDLPVAQLLSMHYIRFFTYRFQQECIQMKSGISLLSQAAEHYAYKEKTYDNLLAFSQEIAFANLYDQLSSQDMTLLCLDPFFIKFKGVVASRKNLYYAVCNVKDTQVRSLMDVCAFQNLCKGYHDVFLLLMKAMSRKGRRSLLQEASEKLIHIAHMERDYIEEFLAMSQESGRK